MGDKAGWHPPESDQLMRKQEQGCSPGRPCWQSPGPAAGKPPLTPRCPSSHHTLSPKRGTHSSRPAPPLGPHRGSDPRSGASVDERKAEKMSPEGWDDVPHCHGSMQFKQCCLNPSDYFSFFIHFVFNFQLVFVLWPPQGLYPTVFT